MRHPTCYVRFDDEGKTVVWTLCPGCAAEIVIHPQTGRPIPWYEIPCPICGMKALEFGYGPGA
ncbi:MAG TPA: hypothetical protein VGE86_10625 [Thermoanaerobaculia bacterium]